MRSNASNQSELFVGPENTPAPLPQKRSKGRPAKSDEIKPQSKKNEAKRDWSNEEVRELITLWKEEKVLYNSKHEKYYNKYHKQKAWKRIASKLISRGFSEIEEAQINQKITSLRSYYGTEQRKEQASKASVAGTSDVYVSSWRFINDLDFLNDNLILRKSYSNIYLETEEAFPSRESGGNIRVKFKRLLKSKALERTGKIMDLVLQRLLQDEKNVNPMEVKETAKSLERIFGDLICQLLGEFPDGEIRGAKTEVQQILVKAKHQAKSREMHNVPYTNLVNVTPIYNLVPPNQPYPSSIQSLMFN